MQANNLALDQASQRHKDDNGFLHVAETNLTKEIVNPYYGKEIPGWREAGLDPNRVYYGYRPAEELAKAASTFDGLPLQMGHHPDSAENPQKEHRVGSIGTGTHWDAPYLKAPLIITDQSAIDAVETGRAREISCAYAYTPDFQHGVHDGISYDFIMRDIRGNHVALVEEGRAGPDVYVADAALAPAVGKETIKQKAGELLMSIFARTFKGAKDSDPEIERKEVELAQAIIDLHKIDPVTGELKDVAEDEDKAAELKAICDKLALKLDGEDLAMLADGLRKLAGIAPAPASDEEQPAKDEEKPVAAAVTEEKKEEVVMDEEYKAILKAAADACGQDAESEAFQQAFAEGVKYGEKMEKKEPEKLDSEHESEGAKKALDEEEVAAAMDAAIKKSEAGTVARLRGLSAAADACRGVLGNVDIFAFDHADAIYGAALKRMGISTEGHPQSAWRSMYLVAAGKKEQPRIVQDAKPEGRFASLNNIIR